MPGNLIIKRLTLAGFKSIDSAGQTMKLGDVTVLLGPNGAGKSNLITFFKLLNAMTTESLQQFVGKQGFADSLLHFGPRETDLIRVKLEFVIDATRVVHAFDLGCAAGDALIFMDEEIQCEEEDGARDGAVLGKGHKETELRENIENRCGKYIRLVKATLQGCRVFQFHDTSEAASVRGQVYIGDNEQLRGDAGNLAAFLYALKNRAGGDKYYRRIVRHIRLILPRFGDFVLRPSPINEDYIRLDWKETDSNYLFGPHQLSDGSIRFMALATLLLQQPATLPHIIVLDEPELGLHPAAISSLAGMIRTASRHCQIIIATQSPGFVDEFQAKNIVIAEQDRLKGRSIFKRLDETRLSEWLDQYSLSELWEKNVLGGRP